MTSIENTQQPAGRTEAELLAQGWVRRFIYDEPRLSEAVEIYRELGLEVALLPVPPDDLDCSECMKEEPERYRVIYTRKREASGEGDADPS
jgi:hypothetical protein